MNDNVKQQIAEMRRQQERGARILRWILIPLFSIFLVILFLAEATK